MQGRVHLSLSIPLLAVSWEKRAFIFRRRGGGKGTERVTDFKLDGVRPEVSAFQDGK
jgi:hypothetical protein